MKRSTLVLISIVLTLITLITAAWHLSQKEILHIEPESAKEFNPNSIATDAREEARPYSENSKNAAAGLKSRIATSWEQVYQELKNNADRDEKLQLTAALAEFADNAIPTTKLPSPLSRLLDIATNDEDIEVRSYAVMNYARIGEASQALDLLKASRLNGTIDHDTYHSELARIYFRSELPERISGTILDEIASAESTYTAEVIFSTIPQADLSRLPQREVEKLADYLQRNRPQFPTDFTSLGIVDTLTYTDWIKSVAIVATGQNTLESMANYLLNHFEKGFIDPREAVSLTLNNPFREMKNSENATALQKLLQEETFRYAASYPNNPVIQLLEI